jgi:cytochrome c-type biogenesis protein CcmH
VRSEAQHRIIGLFAAVLWLVSPQVSALTPHASSLTPEQDARYRSLIHELRCLVCQNQTIADSNAELAADLRKQVHDRIASGQTDADIRRYVTDRYGDFVLYKPPMSGRTVVLWIAPFALVLGGLFIAYRMLRRREAQRQAGTADAGADAQRLRQLLDQEDR